MAYYRAYLYYLTADGYETSTEIQFEADSGDDAVIDAIDWYRGRRAAFLDYFTPLVAVKIYSFEVQRVKDRYLPQDHSGFFFEWKCDWGLPLPAPRDGDNSIMVARLVGF